MCLILSGFLLYFGIEFYLEKKREKEQKRVGITNLTDFELKPIEQQDINYDEAVNMFNSSRSMVTNNRNSSVSMIDANRTGFIGASTLSGFQKDKSGLLTTKLKDKAIQDNVFGTTRGASELKSEFKEVVKLFPENPLSPRLNAASNYETAGKNTVRGEPKEIL